MTDILIGILIAIEIMILAYVAKHPPKKKRHIRRSHRLSNPHPWFGSNRRKSEEYEGLPWMSSPKKRRHDDYKF